MSLKSLAQLRSFSKVLYLQKRRNIRVCLCETFSHLFLFLLLSMGFSLSKILYIPREKYDTISVSIPPVFLRDQLPFNPAAVSTTTLSNNQSTSSNSIRSFISVRELLLQIDYLIIHPIKIPTFDQYITAQSYFGSLFSNQNQISFAFSTSFGSRYGNLILKGSLHFAPYPSPLVDSLVQYLNTTTTTFKTLKSYYHSNEGEAVKYILNNLEERTLALIVLREVSVKKVNYVLRMNYTTLPNTNRIVLGNRGINPLFQGYIKSGYMSVQQVIDDWVFSYVNNISPSSASQSFCQISPSSNIYYEPYPVFEYNNNPFFSRVGFLLGVAMVMSTLYPMSRLVKTVVEEKETRMRELMLIMGLETWVHDLAWWLMSFLLWLWIAISITYLTKRSFLPNSNVTIVFAYFFIFSVALMQFSFLVAVFFNNSKLAAIVAPVVLFSSILPRFIFFTSNDYETVKPKIGASILLPTAFSFGADILAEYEDNGTGVQFSNINSGGYSFLTCLSCMLFDLFFYSVLTWYFDKVLPREFGVRLHPLFFLSPNYWFPKTCLWMRTNSQTPWDTVNQEVSIDINNNGVAEDSQIEPIASGLQSSIKIELKDITKIYPDGKLAVKNLSMCMLDGQITCLLGANGAGKSTTMSMLTGLIPPSSGTCKIFEYSLESELFKIRSLTGICFQQDVIFPQLTVREHILFFGVVKGMALRKLYKEVPDLIDEVGLKEKINTPAGSLSGGMKRKLCLAMALIGNPKFLVIDECTSGMDPSARRATWEILQKRKQGCAMLLSTHYMWEADFLGDRIAIMSEGQLIAMGSSLFLKSTLGDGYVLTMSKETSDCDVSRLTDLVTGIVPNSKLGTVIAGEITYRLNMESTHKFSNLLAALQKDSKSLGIGSFGLSLSSLEQVFVKLASEHSRKNDGTDNVVRNLPEKRNFFANVSKDLQKMLVAAGNHKDKNKSIELVQHHHTMMNVDSDIISYEDPISLESKNGLTEDISIVDHSEHANDTEPSHKEKNSDSSLKAGEDFDVGYNKLLFVQLFQLLYKRYKIATRDLKGFFFQVIFPAAQIFLVLAILTININPAGHTITLNGSMFTKYGSGKQNLQLAQYDSPNFLFNSFSNQTINILNNTVPTSSEMMSDILLGDDSSGKKRNTPISMGSVVLSDKVPMNLSVNYYWVKNNFPAILSYQQEIAAIINVNLSRSYNNFSLTTNQPVIDNLFENDLFTAIALQVLNVTSVAANDTVVKASKVVYDPVSSSIILTGTTITSNGVVLNAGTVTVFALDIVPFLPSDTIEYKIYLNGDTIMHNTSSPHSIGAFNGELLNAAFTKCFNSDARYLSKNHPLPQTLKQALEIKLILSFLASIFVLVPLCYIPASFVSFLVKERSTKAKHLQLISGVSSNMYWTATYIWDMILFTILALSCLCAFAIYGTQSAAVFISSSSATFSLFLLLMLYGFSVIPLSYFYSLGFDNHSTAQISIMAINFFTGFVFVLSYFIMSTIPETQEAAKSLVHIFRIFPPYCLGEGLIAISSTYYSNLLNTRRQISYFKWTVTGRPLVFMFVESIGYFSLILLSEHWSIVWLKQKIDKFRVSGGLVFPATTELEIVDSDVEAERLRVNGQDSDPANYAVLIKELVKLYPPSFLGGETKKAVKNLNLGCKFGEIFGLLGMNGAGKSTTLGITTKDILPSAGEVFICGLPLSNPLTSLYIGYCPQTDPILELLNSYETLYFYGRIRGIKEDILKKRVNDLVIQVGLLKHAARPCGTYSGGNKRKLSLAVALIGDPKLLVLDEPSSGMDPYARRQMWDVISAVSKQRCVILTTHSMEECEALCGRLTIMVMGKMQCIGSVQHLKSRFGSGYSMELRIGTDSITLPQLSIDDKIKMIQEALPLTLDEFREDYIRFTGDNNLSLEEAFKFIEENKEVFNINDYSISQFPLEQIFNKFAENDPNGANHMNTIN